MIARAAAAAATSPATSPAVLEAMQWTRILATTRLPFVLERGPGGLVLRHTSGAGSPALAEARGRAHYALMDVADVVAGRRWSRAVCRNCKGSAFGYVHTAALCAAIATLGRELGGKGAPTSTPRVV